MSNQVFYIEVTSIKNRGAVDQAADESVQGSLLVGVKAALQYTGNHSNYGYDSISIYPAFHDGKRVWLMRESWNPEFGYSAQSVQETIVSFEEGVKIFLQRGIFELPMPVDAITL